MKQIYIILVLFLISSCVAESKLIKIKNDRCVVTNVYETPVWVWWNKNKIAEVDTEEVARQYFTERNCNRADWMSIYQLLTDPNVSGTSGDVFLYKVLKPGESLEIIMCGSQSMTYELIESHLSVINADEFSRIPLFRDFYQSSIEMFNYPFSSVEIDDALCVEGQLDN